MMTTDKSPVGLYVHIPFCAGKCIYCDFYSFRPDEETVNKYIEKICGDIKKSPYVFDTVYLGGGTPSYIGEKRLAGIINSAEKTAQAEITVECNPSDTGKIDRNFDFGILADAGVNRISMGLQSAVDAERKALGRRAGKKEVSRAIERASRAGINNISLDLMLGIPSQTAESLETSLEYCISAGAKHISAYILKVEDGTFLANHRERYAIPDDDSAAEFYLQAADYLVSKGFSHYEISNFSLPGYESSHNLKYWKGKDYLGLGPAAHSMIDGRRFYYDSDINKYLSDSPAVYEDEGGGPEEYLMLSLRLVEGFSLEEFENRYGIKPGKKFTDKCREYSDAGLGFFDGRVFRLNQRGFLVSNSIISSLLCLL